MKKVFVLVGSPLVSLGLSYLSIMYGLKLLIDPYSGVFIYPYSVIAIFLWAFVLTVVLVNLYEGIFK